MNSMSFTNIIEGVSLKANSYELVPRMSCNNRALSAFFQEITQEEKIQKQKLPVFKRKSNPEKADIEGVQQQMFNDLYQRIQVRKHLKKSSIGQNTSIDSLNSAVGNTNKSQKQTISSLQSMCQSFIDQDSTLASIKADPTFNNNNKCAQIQSPQSASSHQTRSKKGHLWSTLKVMQAHKSSQREASLTKEQDNYVNTSFDSTHYSQLRKPQLKLQIKSVNFSKKSNPNRQQSLSSPKRQSIFFYNNSYNNNNQERIGKQEHPHLQNQIDFMDERKSFNVFYDNDEFMSSKYNSFQNRFDQLKQNCQMKQQDSLNTSLSKQTIATNILSTPAKRSRAVTQESSNQVSNKSDTSSFPQISIFQTSPEIISIPSSKNSTNYNNNNNKLNGSDEDIKNNNSSGSDSNISLIQQQQTKPKIKIVLKHKKDNNKNSHDQNTIQSVTRATTHLQESLSQPVSIYPQKQKLFQISKPVWSNRKVNASFEKQNQEEFNENVQNQENTCQMFYSSTRYLEGRKTFIFSNALLHRSPSKFEQDCFQSNNIYKSSE